MVHPWGKWENGIVGHLVQSGGIVINVLSRSRLTVPLALRVRECAAGGNMGVIVETFTRKTIADYCHGGLIRLSGYLPADYPTAAVSPEGGANYTHARTGTGDRG